MVSNNPFSANFDQSGLSREEIGLLRRVAGLMIPQSEAFGVPGADDPIIFADVLASLGRDLPAIREALSLIKQAQQSDAAALAAMLTSTRPDLCTSLVSVITRCYYRDNRVMKSIGMAVRAPYPEGFSIEPNDLTLLDPVKARGRRYRLVADE
ncbi:MAG: hypothetical protein RLZZ613_959 [Pseudomonadota bacterium]